MYAILLSLKIKARVWRFDNINRLMSRFMYAECIMCFPSKILFESQDRMIRLRRSKQQILNCHNHSCVLDKHTSKKAIANPRVWQNFSEAYVPGILAGTFILNSCCCIDVWQCTYATYRFNTTREHAHTKKYEHFSEKASLRLSWTRTFNKIQFQDFPLKFLW